MIDSHDLFNKIIQKICHEIGGEWVLTGGALVRLEYDEGRATQDVDLAFLSHPDESKESLLNRLYRDLIAAYGVGPELVNPAVEFFLEGFEGWRSHLLPFRSGPKGKILRPDLTLFTALKMMRGSELDLEDIQKAIEGEGIQALDLAKLKCWLSESKFLEWKKKFQVSE